MPACDISCPTRKCFTTRAHWQPPYGAEPLSFFCFPNHARVTFLRSRSLRPKKAQGDLKCGLTNHAEVPRAPLKVVISARGPGALERGVAVRSKGRARRRTLSEEAPACELFSVSGPRPPGPPCTYCAVLHSMEDPYTQSLLLTTHTPGDLRYALPEKIHHTAP
jgi:hypothetical protein